MRLNGLSAGLFALRANPFIRDLEIDDARMVAAHRHTLMTNPLLRRLYTERYSRIAGALKGVGAPILEIGCGPSFLEEFVPGLSKTDVVAHANAESVVDAHSLPYADESLEAICLTDVLHHLARPEAFLSEAERCLVAGGKLVLVEPSNSWLQKLATNRGSPHEYCDDSSQEWHNDVTGRLSHANNSLPWMIFVRDRRQFERRFPRLRIRSIRRYTLLAFYLSGGFNYRPFVPAPLVAAVMWLEHLTAPLCTWLGFEMMIVIEKTS